VTGANHVATGALIGASFSAPVALPLALVSHFVLDSLPHHSQAHYSKRSRQFTYIFAADVLLATAVAVLIAVHRPAHWGLMLVAAFLAVCPDAMWLPAYIRTIRQREHLPHNRLMVWHKKIQREYEWGYVTEAVWIILMSIFLRHSL